MPGGLLAEFATSGAGVGLATLCTNPIDVVKVRMQLHSGAGAARAGLISTASNMVANEGFSSLTKGLGPAVTRAVAYGGVRLGLYGPIRDVTGADASFGGKLLAGCASGAIAAAASNPLDLVKTRLQVYGSGIAACSLSGRSASVSLQHSRPNSLALIRQIAQQEGVLALWKGTVPGASRAAVLTASQCATYDEVKRLWLRTFNADDTLATHLGVSMVTGLVTTTATAPVDVIKTQMYVNSSKFSSPLQCAAYLVRQEGPTALLKGWTANYARLGPQTTIIFVAVEKLRQWAGMEGI